ncbi:hypothetical protein UFOVP181_392 [uncultured Caudovirales phage]|uniref:Deoxynucleoside monophosphate kinase n=1 Tax=uncultured Caudovirales phage TaxID=2100421 RepID=A0A6J7WJB8_9CAUD|nr:hypothetical protein UFOVP57_247 [uncultured Caudovirales phage]CAB5209265.1 hypothetical protein UFOVP181_392 [uncultured Caudovirales phage]
MIIGVCGFIGSGKDTIADYLTNFHGFRRESFANSLKDAVSSVFGWDRTLLEGRTKQAREWREQMDPWWTNRLDRVITPRWVLQYWGTEVCRKGFHDDMWIASLENKLRNSTDDIVISDCRFPNEIKSIREAGGIVIRVKRGEDPDWYKDACDMNAGDKCLNYSRAKTRMEALNIHASETAWCGTKFDAVLTNDGTIDDLMNKVKDLVQDRLVSNESLPYEEPADSLNIQS